MYRTPPPKVLTLRRRQYKKHPALRNRRRNRQRQRTLTQRPLRRMLRRLRIPSQRRRAVAPDPGPPIDACDLLDALANGNVLCVTSPEKSATLTFLWGSDVPTVC